MYKEGSELGKRFKTTLEKIKVGHFTFSDFKTSYKVTVIETVWYTGYTRLMHQLMEQNKELEVILKSIRIRNNT